MMKRLYYTYDAPQLQSNYAMEENRMYINC